MLAWSPFAAFIVCAVLWSSICLTLLAPPSKTISDQSLKTAVSQSMDPSEGVPRPFELSKGGGEAIDSLEIPWTPAERNRLETMRVGLVATPNFPDIPQKSHKGQESLVLEDAIESLDLENNYAKLIFLVVSIILLILLNYLGVVYALMNPQRGLPDLIAGTRLVPN